MIGEHLILVLFFVGSEGWRRLDASLTVLEMQGSDKDNE